MKKYRLNLSEYEVEITNPVFEGGKPVIEGGVQATEIKSEVYPLKDNLNSWLRSTGMFKTGEEITEAILLAKQIRDIESDSIELDEKEIAVLKKALNRLLELASDGKANFGGPIHEEAILRVFTAEEIK